MPSSAQTSQVAAVAAPLSRFDSLATLVLVGAGSFLATLDLFIVNIAFPDIRADFPGTTNASLSWVLTTYGIVFAALLVPAGRLADLFGRRRLFRLGMALFAVASAACAAAPSVGLLVAGRAVQAAGAALMVPTSLGLLLAAFPADRHRRVVALWAAIGSIAAACGPPVGGLLVQADWRWIFLVNLPVAVPAVLLGGRLVERRHAEQSPGLPDLVGAGLLAIGIAAVVAALSNASDWGAGSPRLWGCVVIAVIVLAAFVRRCARHPRPVIDLGLFRVRRFAAATVSMSCFYAGFAVMLLGGTLYLTQVWHFGSVRAGLEFAPGPVAATVCALIAGRLPVARRWLAVAGSLAFVVSAALWLGALGQTENYVRDYLPAVLLAGIGVGLSQTSMISAGAAALPAHRYATGTGIINTARQIGSAVGVAVLVALLGPGTHPADYRAAWLVMGIAGLLAAVFAVGIGVRGEGPSG
jgi:EmrB/QacA subfamily drug resistance transporter